ncbi:hypothetical protein ACEQPO_12330 [Bacillus sp. SL00103]
MKAEVYGFESRTQNRQYFNETAEANFALQPLKKRTISGNNCQRNNG